MNLETQRKIKEFVPLLYRKALVYPYMICMGLSERPKDSCLLGRISWKVNGKVNDHETQKEETDIHR